MRKLPIGIQNFKELRTENYYYVDKTQFVKQLVEGFIKGNINKII